MTKPRNIAAIAVALLLASLLAGQVALAEGDQVQRKDFALIGEVVAVDLTQGTFEVAPDSGYWGGGATVTIYTDSATRFAPKGVSLGTLDPGDEVRTSGRLVDGLPVAEVVAVAP
ncbi:MAG: hypothetical protein ACK2T6_00435 [Anaerolineae bacterium]